VKSKITFLSNLSQNLKGFIFLNLEKIKKSQKINLQKQLDKKIIVKLNKKEKKLPSWKQIKQLPKTLNRREQNIIKSLLAIILGCFVFLIYINFFQNLTTVPKNGGELVEGLIGSPLYINPILAQSNVDADLDLSSLIFSGLLKYDNNLELIPDLAEKYEISEDQKTYTFYLKQNVKWHDGEKLTASDIVFTIQSIQDPETKSPLYRSFQTVTVEKVDDYIVKFTIKEPYAAFLNVLTVGIIPQHLWYDIPPINAKLAVYNQKPIGSGPFKFSSLIKGKNGIKLYVLDKNKDYYGQEPYINKLIFKFYPDYENAIDALNNKEVESLSFLPKEYLKKFTNKRKLNLNNVNLSQYTALFFNSKNNDLLKDKKIREALSYAIDKNKIIDNILQNQGQIIDGPILPGFLGYNPNIKKYEYNPQKSLEILSTNGWTLDGEYLKKGDQEFKITVTTVEQTEKIKLANLLKEFWNSIGVNVELQIIPKDKIEKDIISPRNYQILLYAEITGYDPDPFSFWHSSQRDEPGVNLAMYANRKADQLLEEARLTNNKDVRNQKYQDFQNILIDDLPAIFLYTPTYTYPINKKVKGINLQRMVNPYDRFININNWYIKTKKVFNTQ
jgi:peptide/nickel transport system substrate-binding protein